MRTLKRPRLLLERECLSQSPLLVPQQKTLPAYEFAL